MTATRHLRWRLAGMGETAEHYRQRAAHCRELAASATDQLVMKRLLELADDFEEEAREIDGFEAGPKAGPH